MAPRPAAAWRLGRLLRCHPWCAGGLDPVPAEPPRLFTLCSRRPAPSAPPASERPPMTDIRRTLLWVVFSLSLFLHLGRAGTSTTASRRSSARRRAQAGRAGGGAGADRGCRRRGRRRRRCRRAAGAPRRRRRPRRRRAAPRRRRRRAVDGHAPTCVKATLRQRAAATLVRLELLQHADPIDRKQATWCCSTAARERLYLAQTGPGPGAGGVACRTTRRR